MRIRDLVAEGAVSDFVGGFKQGLNRNAPAKGAIKQHFKSRDPYAQINPRDMRSIIDAVLTKKPLAPEQEALLRDLARRL